MKMTAITLKFKYKSATANLRIFSDNYANIYDFKAKKKRRGHGTKLIKKILKYCDKNEIEVYLLAERYGKNGFNTNKELVEFYKTFGFEELDDPPVHLRRKRRKK